MGDLFERIRTTMPRNEPGQFSVEAYLDIIAYLLQFNDFSPGAEELNNQLESLNSRIDKR